MIEKKIKNVNGEHVVIEEKYDKNENILYYKQWNNNKLVVHREWELISKIEFCLRII